MAILDPRHNEVFLPARGRDLGLEVHIGKETLSLAGELVGILRHFFHVEASTQPPVVIEYENGYSSAYSEYVWADEYGNEVEIRKYFPLDSDALNTI